MARVQKWYADWFAGRPWLVLDVADLEDAKAAFRFTPVCAYPKGVEVLETEVGFLPEMGVRVMYVGVVH